MIRFNSSTKQQLEKHVLHEGSTRRKKKAAGRERHRELYKNAVSGFSYSLGQPWAQAGSHLRLAVLEPLGGLDVLLGRVDVEGALGAFLVVLGGISAEGLVLLCCGSDGAERRWKGWVRLGLGWVGVGCQ